MSEGGSFEVRLEIERLRQAGQVLEGLWVEHVKHVRTVKGWYEVIVKILENLGGVGR